MTQRLIASARMYAVAPGATAAWARLLAEIAHRAGLALDIIAHAYPASLHDLWSNPNLGCAFMCGWPLALENQARPVIAAPVPTAEWSAGQAIYRSDFIVAASSSFHDIPETFGHRLAYNATISHSGVNMPQTHLAAWASQAPLYTELVGPLTTVRRCVEAVAEGRAEITAVDSFGLDLIRRHDPTLAAAIRIVGSTAPSPIPPLVGGPALTEAQRQSLSQTLQDLETHETGNTLLADLCLTRFIPATPETYKATLSVAPAAGPFRLVA